jgi:hypothetical protein
MHANPLIVRAYAARGAQLWIATRGLLSVLLVLAGINPVDLSVAAVVEIIALSVAVSFFDVHRRHERAFLANLGVHPLSLTVFFAVPALLAEVAVRIGGAMVR